MCVDLVVTKAGVWAEGVLGNNTMGGGWGVYVHGMFMFIIYYSLSLLCPVYQYYFNTVLMLF